MMSTLYDLCCALQAHEPTNPETQGPKDEEPHDRLLTGVHSDTYAENVVRSRGVAASSQPAGPPTSLFIGARVRTQFTREEGGDDRWYCGVVTDINLGTQQASVRYDDGETWTGSWDDIYETSAQNQDSPSGLFYLSIIFLLFAAALLTLMGSGEPRQLPMWWQACSS